MATRLSRRPHGHGRARADHEYHGQTAEKYGAECAHQ
jgi:hypothetical protein